MPVSLRLGISQRRTDWHKFFRQVYNSGIARINLYKKYPDSLKLVHLLPAAFTLGVLFSWSEASSALGVYCRSDFSVCLSLRILRFRIKASNRLPVDYRLLYPTVRIRLWILDAAWNRLVLKKEEFSAFQKTFYK